MNLSAGKWEKHGAIMLRGYLLESPAQLSGINDVSALKTWLEQANGCFALVLQTPAYTVAAVDRIRSIPLFYDLLGNLADRSESIAPLHLSHLRQQDQTVFAEYLITGFVTGNQTLHPDILQIPAGHMLILKQGHTPELKAYYKYFHQEETDAPANSLVENLDALHRQSADRLIKSLNGRPAVIPLSGGWDSRLIAYLLKKAKYPAIYTFSYEAANNPESRISQKVARYLNLPWFFIEHTHRSWYQAYFSPERVAHYKYAMNATSSPHIQDWLAVRELKAKRLIPPDSVFIPGHTGDFLQSGHLSECYRTQKVFSGDEVARQILARHYHLWRLPRIDWEACFESRVKQEISLPVSLSAQDAASLFEYWELQERQAKFIVNSVRVYEDMGYDWRLPLWDARLMEFWAEVPVSLRFQRRLWNLYQERYLPIPVPVFRNLGVPTRIRNKILRVAFGEITDTRYGRFAEYRNPLQYASEKVESYLVKDLDYPSFVKADCPIIRCDMNALQALRAICELPR